jgi:hypothetical protein
MPILSLARSRHDQAGIVARPVHIATEQLQNRRPYLTLSTEPPFGSKRDPVGLPAGD